MGTADEPVFLLLFIHSWGCRTSTSGVQVGWQVLPHWPCCLQVSFSPVFSSHLSLPAAVQLFLSFLKCHHRDATSITAGLLFGQWRVLFGAGWNWLHLTQGSPWSLLTEDVPAAPHCKTPSYRHPTQTYEQVLICQCNTHACLQFLALTKKN